VALDDKAARRLHKQYQLHRQLGFPLEWLGGAEARRREPNLGPEVQAAIFSALGHRVDNRRLVLALRQAFLRAGGMLQEHSRVIEILSDRQRVQGVRLAHKHIPAETVILAAGAWSGQIGGLPNRLPRLVEPLKGQTITLQMPRQAPLIRQPLIGPVYLVPRRDGRLILGTTVEEEAGFDIQPTVGGVLDILGKAQAIVPRISALPVVEMGAGLRPTGPERLPVLGPAGLQGFIIATGGHSYGLLLSPIVAQAISQLALTGQVPDLIKPFAPY
jgi:glycine oxidase